MSMVIGGLLNSEDGKTVSKIPLLGNIPILGEFFKHTSRTRDKRELIIIITPHLIAEDTQWPMSDGMKEAFNEGQTEYGSLNRVKVNEIEPEVEKAIARNIEKRAADKAKRNKKKRKKKPNGLQKKLKSSGKRLRKTAMQRKNLLCVTV